MQVILGSDKDGFELKEFVKANLTKQGYDVIDLTPTPAKDFIESSLAVTKKVLENGIKKSNYV